MSSDSQMAATYIPQQQYTRWKSRAESLDMSVSEFIKSMVEAGNKKFKATVDPDETASELREQRNHYQQELENAQDRVSKLETRLDQGERAEIRRFIESNPGATFEEITTHLIETVPERTNELLESLEGDAVRVDGDGYYPDRASDEGRE
jgi:molecular chaperone DnaK (HSP70)